MALKFTLSTAISLSKVIVLASQEGYVVLAEEERAKGFVRPVRASYKHLTCGGITTMGRTLAETYARDPYFYSGTLEMPWTTIRGTSEAGLAEFILNQMKEARDAVH